ncbi:hypothetical protein CKO_04774 [Citrobacter koseri ATCC BAA-895]|uniref:Uncharacterized protein n=1 Tax=Citrobacter koseri (strain ATCC BAA-895 / CDC 4225-83 / SGSC4696) TaxID=290338 RepID=A8AQQ6_CITK8|nr:hypothetical protein CKO_04774 [Citrobacter koseri ATCC BAA-895]
MPDGASLIRPTNSHPVGRIRRQPPSGIYQTHPVGRIRRQPPSGKHRTDYSIFFPSISR